MAPDTPVLVGAITLGSHMSHMDSLLLSARAGATALLARHPEGLLPVCGDSCILAWAWTQSFFPAGDVQLITSNNVIPKHTPHDHSECPGKNSKISQWVQPFPFGWWEYFRSRWCWWKNLALWVDENVLEVDNGNKWWNKPQNPPTTTVTMLPSE